MALEWKERDERIPFAKFNCLKHVDFCEQLVIPVFPFLKFYIRGHPIPYYGKRIKHFINEFLEEILNI